MSNIFLNCTFELAPLIWKILDPQNYDGVIFTFRHVVLLFEMSRSPQMRLRYGKKNLVAVKNFLMSLALCTWKTHQLVQSIFLSLNLKWFSPMIIKLVWIYVLMYLFKVAFIIFQINLFYVLSSLENTQLG